MSYDFPFPKLESRLVKKLDLMILRCTRKNPEQDAVVIIEGPEGSGKTNDSLTIAGYVKSKTGREVHLFFRLKQLIDFAKSNREKIIIWDEPSLDALSTDSLKRLNKDLIRLLMTCRYKRHFFIMNLTKFSKFSEYIVVDRSHGFIHKSKNRIGHGIYIRGVRLEGLWNDYKKYKKRNYKFHKSFYVDFPCIMTPELYGQLDVNLNGVAHSTLEHYNKAKDDAIGQIGESEEDNSSDKAKQTLNFLKATIGRMKSADLSWPEFIKRVGIPERTLRAWQKMPLKGEWSDFRGSAAAINKKLGGLEKTKNEAEEEEEYDDF